MLKLLKFLFSLILIAVIAVIVVYFLPGTTKEKILTRATGIIPEEIREKVKEKTEELILTPPEQREKLIAQLEDKITRLRETSPTPAVHTIIQETESVIAKLKEKNDDASLTSIVTQKIVEQFIGEEKQTSEETRCLN